MSSNSNWHFRLRKDQLRSLSDILGLSAAGRNTEHAERILHFLMEPTDDGKVVPERKASMRSSKSSSLSSKESKPVDEDGNGVETMQVKAKRSNRERSNGRVSLLEWRRERRAVRRWRWAWRRRSGIRWGLHGKWWWNRINGQWRSRWFRLSTRQESPETQISAEAFTKFHTYEKKTRLVLEVLFDESFFTLHSLVLASTSASKRRGTPAKKAVERKKTTEETTPSVEPATSHEDNHPGETNRAESIVGRWCMDHSLSPFCPLIFFSSLGWTSLNHRYKTSRTNGRWISRTADTRGKCH